MAQPRERVGLLEHDARRWAGAPIHVLVVGQGRRRPGLHVHRTNRIHPDELTRVDGVPVTAPARTLYDLAGSGGGRVVERAVARALRDELTSREEILAVLGRYEGRPGVRFLRALVGDRPPDFVRSEAEGQVLALVRRGRLPKPRANGRVGRFEVDFHWPAQKVVLEVDGFEFHSPRAAFERDRERDAELAARGHRVIRVTWRQLTSEPEAVLVRLARALEAG